MKNSHRLLVVALFVVVGFAAGTFYANRAAPSMTGKFASAWEDLRRFWGAPVPAPQPATNGDGGQTIRVVAEESQVIDVVKRAAPAVVSIVASADVPNIEVCYRSPFDDEAFGNLPDGFGFDFRIPGYCQRGTRRERVGAGSGFLVSADGYVVTNKHVVDDERAEYTVILNDESHRGEKVVAKVLALDPTNDIAILKIDRTGLPFLNFGDSDALQVGQTAIAIGYSLGEFDNTVSKGVISGLRRSITAGGSRSRPEQLDDIIQTDAAINPGNSGGPLLDIAGDVIGVNVAMAQAQSIGFALPGNLVSDVVEQVKTSGKIQRPFLGVHYLPITPEVKERNHLTVGYGAWIARGQESDDPAVVPGSPADLAGLQENDIILEVAGDKVEEPGAGLTRLIAKRKAGETVTLKILRKGKEQTVKVTLGSR